MIRCLIPTLTPLTIDCSSQEAQIGANEIHTLSGATMEIEGQNGRENGIGERDLFFDNAGIVN